MRRPSVHPIIVLVTLGAITLIGLLSVGEAQTKHYFDPPMLTVISVAYFAAALVMLVRTQWRAWTILGTGLLATMLGDSALYAYFLLPRIGVEVPFQTVWLALIRALLFIGGPFVLLGLAREEIRVFRDTRAQAATRTEQDEREDALVERSRVADIRDRRAAARDELLLDDTASLAAQVAGTVSNTAKDVEEIRVDVKHVRKKIVEEEAEGGRS